MKKLKRTTLKEKETDLILKGIAASPGIVIGTCFLYEEPSWEPEPRTIPVSRVNKEIGRFRKAVKDTHNYLKKTYEETVSGYDDTIAEIINIQIVTLEDKEFLTEVEDRIRNSLFDAAYATFVVFKNKKEHFLRLSNEYFRDRAQDVQALKKLILKNLIGEKPVIALNMPSIVVADVLSPTDTIKFHRQKVLGLATNSGGKNSHAAIVARSLSIPSVVGLQHITDMVNTGDILILNGNRGEVIVNPSQGIIQKYEDQRRAFLDFEQTLVKEYAREAKTRDGSRIEVMANIEFEEELEMVSRVGADGIGLFRTEAIFFNKLGLPSENELTEIYRYVAGKMFPKTVVIRTLDVGGDKIFPDIMGTQEQNPFLGWRAIRFCIDHPDLFIVQLKAILRANARGNVKILLPMVSSLEEVRTARELLDEARSQLRKEGKKFGERIELGIMVEIPSVAIYADHFATEVDFLSIGTNDLVQYTLAVDRGNERVAKLYSYYHPAVLRTIQMTIEAGKNHDTPVSMCGEMAGDPVAVPLLIAMGFDSLSASHLAIPELKRTICDLSVAECKEVYERVMEMKTAQEIGQYMERFYKSKFSNSYLI